MKWNYQQLRGLFWLLAAIILIISAITAIMFAILPYDYPLNVSNTLVSERPFFQSTSSLPSLQDFTPLWSQEYRRPLFDVATAPKVVVKTPFGAHLTGTIIEPGYSRAMFTLKGQSNQVKLCAVGESIAGAQLLEIKPESVRVMYENEEIEIHIGREGGN